jgi:hypothetical protein
VLPDLTPGDRLSRREVHARYGGRLQGGISPSNRLNAVLFFMGEADRLHDGPGGWDDSGDFHYVGEGQRGDHRLTQGNKAILNHRQDGRTLEGFRQADREFEYLGEFDLVRYYFTDALDVDAASRQVVVFLLHPHNDIAIKRPALPAAPRDESSVLVPLATVDLASAKHRGVSVRSPKAIEADLVRRYAKYLEQQGHQVARWQIVVEGQRLYCDLVDVTRDELIEVKGSVARSTIRAAVGQLLDYQRFVDASALAVLVPSRPRPDLVDFLLHVGVAIIHPDEDRWVRISPERGGARQT